MGIPAKWIVVVIALLELWTSPAIASDVVLLKPKTVKFNFKDDENNYTCDITHFTDTDFFFTLNNKDYIVSWSLLDLNVAVSVRFACNNDADTDDLLSAAHFAWDRDQRNEAKQAIDRATKIDPTLKHELDKLPDNRAANKPKATTLPSPVTPPGLLRITKSNFSVLPLSSDKPAADTIPFVPATPEQTQLALDASKQLAKSVEKISASKLDFLDSDHFVIFSDWPKAEQRGLKIVLEDAYKLIVKQLDASTKDNIYFGKMAVYAVADQLVYQRLLERLEKRDQNADKEADSKSTLLVHNYTSRLPSRMYLFKPDFTDWSKKEANNEKLWQSRVVAGCCAVFLDRYKSNTKLPIWLNVGLCRVISASVYVSKYERAEARIEADNQYNEDAIRNILDDGKQQWMRSRQIIFQTIVEMLYAENRKSLIKMLDEIKEGNEPEDALRRNYKISYDKLARAWRDYAKTIPIPNDYYRTR